ncbi:MAG: polyphenol oxidase family protein, partial [Candidatus Marinimicrobia bacterium]|nr:polyphenol oxidase family protein [Candidatus Neomarinimicrobiota bacterium]
MRQNGVLTFRNFSSYPEIIHGFSTRQFGDLKPRNISQKNQNLDVFLKHLGIGGKQLVVGEQLHRERVAVVDGEDRGCIIPGVDGLISKDEEVFLGVNIADCIPMLFYDPEKKIVAVCHAGWKGTLKKIGQKVIEKMGRLGSKPERIIVGIGPHIKACCYNIPHKRARPFYEEFGDDGKMIKLKDK